MGNEKGLLYTTIRNRKVTLFMMVILIIFGFYSLYIIPKQEDPDINVSVALITTVYPGASSEVVEKLVTKKLEEILPEVEGYDYSESYSKNNLSIIVLRLNVDADVDKAWEDLRSNIDDIRDELPEGLQAIDINTDLDDTAGIIISLSGENYTYSELEAYADNMKKDLMKVDGIARFEITGKQEYQVKITLNQAKLRYLNLSLGDIVNTIKAQNVQIPLGAIDNNDSKINVNVNGMYSEIDEIKNTIIAVSNENGSILKLKDIADIQLELKDSNYKIRHNEKNAVLLTGYFKKNKNIILTGKDVEDKLSRLKTDLPKDIHMEDVIYQPKDVSDSINNFMLNLLIGILIVMLVVFLSMGFRNAVIVSTAIPLSLLITFSIMYLLDIRVHQISISALIISLGMLVDNAIVISDAIQVRIDNDENKVSACVNGAKDVAIPVLTSTLTTVFAFVPLLILPGMAGEFIKTLPQIIIIALSSSYFVAIFVSPTMAYLFFSKTKKAKQLYRIRNLFDKLLHFSFKWKKTVLAIIVIIFVSSIYLSTFLGLQFFPKSDKNILYIDIDAEHQSNFRETEQATEQVEKILKEQEEITSFTSALGGGLPKFFYSMSPKAKSEDTAQIMLRIDLSKTDHFTSNGEFANHLQETLDAQIVGGNVAVKELEQGEPIGAPIVIRIIGDNQDELMEKAIEIKQILSTIEGTINIDDDISDKIYEYTIDIDTNQASSLGLTKYDIQKEVNIALRGEKASVFRTNDNEFDILVTSNINSKAELENLTIKSSITGAKYILKQVADVKLESRVPSIYKYDQEQSVTVLSDVKPGFSSIDIQNKLKAHLDETAYNGLRIVFDGEESRIKSNFGGMGEAAVFIVFLIFIILLIQFNSIIQPFIIILTIPLSVIGSIVGLYLLRQPLSFTSLLGLVSLMGIVVNNAIVLVDYINNERKKGKELEIACMEATNKRFRPIMLTTLTTIIGLMPLAFSGSNLFVPMAISIISGLLLASLFTLVAIPLVYSTIEGRIATFQHKKQSKNNIHSSM